MPTYVYRGAHPTKGVFTTELTHDRDDVVEELEMDGETVAVKKVYTPFLASFKGGGWANH
jgi:predicted nucleic acid-binding Zn ribbon protein